MTTGSAAAPAPAATGSDMAIRTASSSADASSVDIVAKYQELLVANPDLTKPVIAIKALIALLDSASSSTAHETIDILKAGSERLEASVRNPLPLTAGTHLFLRFTLQMLKEQDGNFDVVRQHLLKNGQLFAQRAIDARNGVAEKGWRFVRAGTTIMTHGASRAVICLLERAQKERPGQFNVIYVMDDENLEEGERVVKQLRSCGIPTSPIPFNSVLYRMRTIKPRVDMVFLGGEVITQDGGIVSRMGTCAIATLANQCNIDVYACGEEHKFSGYHPIGPTDVGFQQESLHITTDDVPTKPSEQAVDWTPGSLFTHLVTETGIHVPTSRVVEVILETYGHLNG